MFYAPRMQGDSLDFGCDFSRKQIGGWSAKNGTLIPKSYTRAWRPNKQDKLFVSIKY